MNKPLLLPLLSGCMIFAGCSDKEIDRYDSGDVDSPIVSFAPLAASPVLSTPNDLLLDGDSMSPTFGRLAGIPDQDTADVFASTAQLDGWGLTTPFTIGIELPNSDKFLTTLNASSVEQEGVVYIFKCPEGASIITSGCSDPSSITKLTYGTDYTLTATDDGIQVTPLKPLEANTGYFLGVTDKALDSYGQPVTRSETFNTYSTGTGSGSAAEVQLNGLLNGTNTLLGALTEIPIESFTYSATWTTQDVEVVAKTVMADIAGNVGAISGITDQMFTVRTALAAQGVTFEEGSQEALLADNIKVYKGTLDLRYYLPFPGLPDNNNGSPADDNGLTDCFSPLCGNWLNGSGQSPWKGSAAPVPATDPLTSALKPNLVDVLLLVPTALVTGTNDVKIAQYVHGITSIKETAYAISLAMASQNFAVIAIDQPLHGERSFDANADMIYEVTATDPGNGPAFVNGDAAVFANLASLLTARDNLRQAAADQLSLRYAISSTDLSSLNANIDESHVSLVGVSLGSIVGTVAQGMSEIHSDDSFKFKASALSVGGAQVGAILGYSNTFGPTTQASLVSTTSFSGGIGPNLGYSNTYNPAVNDAVFIQAATTNYGAAAQAALGLTAEEARGVIGASEDQANAEFNSLIALGYPGFLQVFINGAQSVVDSGDSSIWATKTTTTPTLAHQVIGNGADSLSDQVIPNETASNGYPLGGTQGLFNALALTQTSETVQGASLRNYVNFTQGGHGSALDPSASAAATTEMQSQIVGFLASEGQAVIITDTSVVE